MGMDSTPIQERTLARQSTEPASPIDGFYWINPSGGNSGNNAETYTYNKSAGTWELIRSVGPDTPNYPASGAMWRDTGNGKTKTYDGNSWVNVGVTDHANLTNVTSGQHHTKASLTVESPQDVTSSRSQGTQYTNDTGNPIRVYVKWGLGSLSNLNVNMKIDGNQVGEHIINDSTSSSDEVSMSMLVPDGSTYTVSSFDNSNSVVYWLEQEIIVS